MKTNENTYMKECIEKLLKRCINKKMNNINPLLVNYFTK